MTRASPNRRRGEGKAAARKRAKATGLCQGCGRKKNNAGRLCTKCLARAARRSGPKRDDWQ